MKIKNIYKLKIDDFKLLYQATYLNFLDCIENLNNLIIETI